MQITRDRFIDQFAISFQVHVLRVWHRRSKEPPDHVGRAMYETILTCKGTIPISSVEFGRIVEPVVRELHRMVPTGQRPDASDLAGRIYDVLDAARTEVTILPPVRSHGGGK